MRSTLSACLWHIALAIFLVLGFLMLPLPLFANFALLGAMGWLAGSSIPYRDDPHGR